MTQLYLLPRPVQLQDSQLITVDGLQFTRLAGGRPVFADRPQSIDYAGDAEAGARIVENLAYVI